MPRLTRRAALEETACLTTSSATSSAEGALVRALGVRQLTASIVNATIGAGIFVLPGLVAARLGDAAPVAFVVCAVAMAVIVTVFALAGSRVSLTGGLYAYVETAFGPFVGYIAGVLQWVMQCLSVSGVMAAFASQIGTMWPALGSGAPRVAVLALAVLGLAWINVRGVVNGSRLIETLTLAKLLPLILFVGVGVFFLPATAWRLPSMPSGDVLGETILLLIFAFVGIEVALVPSGEIKNPSRTVPRAIYIALVVTTVIYIGVQLVAQGILGPALAQSTDAPLAEAASRFLGQAGRTLVLVGGAVSMLGYMSGDMLGTPRQIFALARDGFLPSPIARVHPRFRTPWLAIICHAVIVLVLASSNTFEHLAVLANVALLLLYSLCCLATLELLRKNVRTGGVPFSFPGERAVPVAALAVIVWILSHATAREWRVVGAVLAVACVLYAVRRLIGPRPAPAVESVSPGA